MANENALHPLEMAIDARSRRRGLTTDLVRLRYANGYIYDRKAYKPSRTVLYVGVGHGLDALLALIDNDAERVIGVDPYIAEDGNDDADYLGLLGLIRSCGLEHRFELNRSTLDNFRPQPGTDVDRIVINDVLHHIFLTPRTLRDSPLFTEAQSLFTRLCGFASLDARLVVSDVMRAGIRPILARAGLLHTSIDYSTKQNWREWDAAATSAGWRRAGLANYVPFRLRRWGELCVGPLARYVICHKYFLTYERERH